MAELKATHENTVPEQNMASNKKQEEGNTLQQKAEVLLSQRDAVAQHQLQAYSVFSKKEKYIAVFFITITAMFSPLSSFIFFPAINALSDSLKVSVEKINLTITSYMIVAGLAPAIVGDMADITGRRNVYLLTLFIYVIANIGLAVQNSWIALFLLRMMQSAGGAATIAMGYGVISDIAAPSERGGYVGVVLLGPNLVCAIGPIIGGALVEAPGWRWIFWIPAIAAGICLLCIALFLPETARSIVGNGSRKVSTLYRPIVSYGLSRAPTDVTAGNEEDVAPRKFRIPNPLASLKVLASRSSILITGINGIYYMDFSCLQGSMSTLFIDIYKLSELKVGLVYVPFGIGSCVGAYCSGKVMNRDYRLTARAHNLVIDIRRGDDLSLFPIEKARFRSIWYSMCATGICTTGYGWALQTRSHMAIPLVLQFIIGFATAMTFNTKLWIFALVLQYSSHRPQPQVPSYGAGREQYCPLFTCRCRTCLLASFFGCNGSRLDIHLIGWTMHGLPEPGMVGVEVWDDLEAQVGLEAGISLIPSSHFISISNEHGKELWRASYPLRRQLS
ncbi:Major facilitator superfamily domain general substrate transporter [Penicillium longicatenatum]|uniref:Major facilitator superfamily domain general substrate transporter n=1 Tax=Penicillium longicatenatum TaxID=1561947 RepID=UPI002548D949|nr:Major facilitator superfamily domain general substrate transporter [Penicillium longicatenatum]KAJ5657798.1 Major facilitator superfamily domain general substrate transporter [Penicillium longicatenatum]